MELPIELDEVPEPQHDCLRDDRFERINSPVNSNDWESGGSSQGYVVFRCKECGDIWGCRYQYDPGTGHDDKWKRFGEVDPASVRRHY